MNWTKWRRGLLVSALIGFVTACAAAAMLDDVKVNLKFILFFIGLIGKDILLYCKTHPIESIEDTTTISKSDVAKVILASLLPAFLLTGCGTSKLVRELAKDPATVSMKIHTIYGSVDLIRTVPGTNSVSIKDGNLEQGVK